MFGINSARFSTRLRRPPTSHPHHSLQYGLPPRPSFWARLGKGLAYSQGLTQGAEWGKGRRLGSQDRATGPGLSTEATAGLSKEVTARVPPAPSHVTLRGGVADPPPRDPKGQRPSARDGRWEPGVGIT